MEKKEELIALANDSLEKAYCPYSNFKVGAALLGQSGKIYTGVNVENSSYPAGICAERTALVKAVSEGEQDFQALVVTSSSPHATSPCGICRQMLSEFCPADMLVILTHQAGEIEIETSMGQLLPGAFSKDDM